MTSKVYFASKPDLFWKKTKIINIVKIIININKHVNIIYIIKNQNMYDIHLN